MHGSCNHRITERTTWNHYFNLCEIFLQPPPSSCFDSAFCLAYTATRSSFNALNKALPAAPKATKRFWVYSRLRFASQSSSHFHIKRILRTEQNFNGRRCIILRIWPISEHCVGVHVTIKGKERANLFSRGEELASWRTLTPRSVYMSSHGHCHFILSFCESPLTPSPPPLPSSLLPTSLHFLNFFLFFYRPRGDSLPFHSRVSPTLAPSVNR